MITETHDAWVLHTRPSGDTSLWVTFFTRTKGLLSCLYKGGRKPKNQALLQPFQPLWLATSSRGDCHFVQQLELQKNEILLTGRSLFAALYMNELLIYSLSPLESQENLFAIYHSTMLALASSQDKLTAERVLRHFEWCLLEASGYSGSWTEEAGLLIPIDSAHCYQFVAGEGFVRTARGIAGAHILALAQGELEDLQVLKTAKFIMRQAIDHLLGGRVLKSRSLFLSHSKKLACKSL